MTKYISNVNGDWWEYHPEQPIFILDTADLTAEQLSAIIDEHGGFEEDKFEDVITQYGKQATLHV